jgi:hypothetical protein
MKRRCAAFLALESFFAVATPAVPARADVPAADGATPVVVSPAQPSPPADEGARRPRRFLSKGLSLGLVAGTYGALGAMLYQAWYAHGPKHGFEWSHDGWLGTDTYSGGADKVGHVYATYLLTRATAGLMREGGWDPVVSTAVGVLSTSAVYFAFELRDGYTTGFSYRDMVANLLGVSFGAAMLQVPWLDERFDMRVEYWPSEGYIKNFKNEGFNFNEDYNGLTFLLAYHLSSVAPIEEWKLPLRFADVVIGFNTQGYRPRPDDLRVLQRQRTFVGVSLNMQRVVDELWLGDRHPKPGDSAGPGHRFVQFMTELFNLPFTSAPVFTVERQHESDPLVEPGS